MKLSVVIITKNEADAIRDCLASVSWADEIIVLDSGSTDNTVAICREFGAQVTVSDDWPGFGPQKNRALELAHGDWILSLDADERVTPALRAELEAAMDNPENYAAFRLPRRSSYCGRFMRHSGWWPDHVTRLFQRGQARFNDVLVHESLTVQGMVGTLHQPLLHIAFTSMEEVLDKVDRYSSASAAMLHARGRKASLSSAILHGLWSFVRTYLLRGGFLDGREGFMLAVSNAEGTYYRYIKLMLLSESKQ